MEFWVAVLRVTWGQMTWISPVFPGQDHNSDMTYVILWRRIRWRNPERLIWRTAVGTYVHLRWSVQRFERDTYHGDALPTELTGPIFTCLTWGFMLPGHPCGSCIAVAQRRI